MESTSGGEISSRRYARLRVDAGSWWSTDDDGITVSLRVTPGARRSELVDAVGDRMRVRIAARAVEGQANAELERVVAALFGVRRAAVTVVRGHHARDKTVRIAGVTVPPPELRGGRGRHSS